MQEQFFREMQEKVTLGLRSINTDHAYIHEGIAYKSFIELSAFPGEVTEIVYVIKTPEDKDLHFKNLKLQAKGGTVKATIKRSTAANPIVFDETGAEGEEEPTVGTETIAELTGPVNLNDYFGASGVVWTKTPTFDTSQDGEDWFFVKILGDATNQFTSVDTTGISDNEEVVMKANTYYLVVLDKESDTPEDITLTTFWYEEPPYNS